MKELSYQNFIRSLPPILVSQLPAHLQHIKVKQPFRWIIQFHFGEPRLHYEVSRVARTKDLELALHLEAKNKPLNRYLLEGFQRNLVEVKDRLGDGVEAEMWDKGWAKVYEVLPAQRLTADYQQTVAHRLAKLISCLHPIFIELRAAER